MGHTRDHWPTETGGRPLAFGPEVVERCLWEVAAAGGQVRKAHQALLSATDGDVQAMEEIPGERTIRSWIGGRFRNRYHEILREKSEQLDERLAQQASGLAARMLEAEERALVQTMNGLGTADGVEASVILRNLAQSKKVQVDSAAQLRGKSTAVLEVRGLDQLAGALARMGVAEIVEGSAEEIPDAALALSSGAG